MVSTKPGQPGVGVDSHGGAVVDPTANVLQLVEAAIQRQDDLREVEAKHIREIMGMQVNYQEKLALKETARIDAIRAVDVGAVNRAAEVASTQAATLATQVATSAETLRNQVAATATVAEAKLAAALVPLQESIADLRRAQYEAQGQKAQVGDTRLNMNTIIMFTGVVLSAIAIIVTLVILI